MDANDIVIYFSVFVSVCIMLWAIWLIRTFDKIGRD
ncbi:MAG: hypothetical protein ACI9OT_000605, partial [Gammaproteobacteria bacterium]